MNLHRHIGTKEKVGVVNAGIQESRESGIPTTGQISEGEGLVPPCNDTTMSTDAPGSQELLLGLTRYFSGAVVLTCRVYVHSETAQ